MNVAIKVTPHTGIDQKYASTPEKSPIFNGDPYTLGSNGTYVPHNGTILLPPAGVEGGLGYNPRCLKRDVGPALALKYTNTTSILHLLLANRNIQEFRTDLEGIPYTPAIGAHGGGHFVINGDPGGDLFTSPGDPTFYLHHGQVDRVWSYWEVLDPRARQNAIVGTNTWMNSPPSADTTLDDIPDLGYAGPSIRLGDTMSTTSGPFCYIYI